METHQLSPALGVEVHGLDLTRPIDTAARTALRQAMLDHHLILVRGQAIDHEHHLAFAEVFGRVASERHGRIGLVSNVRADRLLGSDAATWHADYTFFPAPYEALSLYGLEIPARGTTTSFASGVLAARTLPPELRRRVEGLQGRAVLAFDGGSLSDGVRYRIGRCDDAVAHQLRPVLWPHRTTGEPILAVWEQQTDALMPLPARDSDALLDQLFAHLYRPEHQYVHQWVPNDLIIWDNHALQHSRARIETDEPRSLRRVCVGSDQDLSPFTTRRNEATTT